MHFFLCNNVANSATIVTDAYRSYSTIGKAYNHITVKHTEGTGYVVKVNDHKFHTNNIENFWAQLKRGYVGIYHYMSPKHLAKYCDEFASRYNNRDISNVAHFTLVVRDAKNARITYKQLTK